MHICAYKRMQGFGTKNVFHYNTVFHCDTLLNTILVIYVIAIWGKYQKNRLRLFLTSVQQNYVFLVFRNLDVFLRLWWSNYVCNEPKIFNRWNPVYCSWSTYNPPPYFFIFLFFISILGQVRLSQALSRRVSKEFQLGSRRVRAPCKGQNQKEKKQK